MEDGSGSEADSEDSTYFDDAVEELGTGSENDKDHRSVGGDIGQVWVKEEPKSPRRNRLGTNRL